MKDDRTGHQELLVARSNKGGRKILLGHSHSEVANPRAR